MKRHNWRRVAMLFAALTIVLFFVSAITYAGTITVGEVTLGAVGFLFAYIVARLMHTLAGANPEGRRRAARWLVIASIVPALLLTPSVLERAPANTHAHIVVASLVWAALAMAFTSYFSHRATRRVARQRSRNAPLSALIVQRLVQSTGDRDVRGVDDDVSGGVGGDQIDGIENPTEMAPWTRHTEADREQ